MELNGSISIPILIVAIVTAIMGGFVLSSVNADQQDVTKYEYLTDVTGLFAHDNMPQFVDYNSSANYTGYYTDPSTRYWDGVDYTQSSKPNNYKLNVKPSDIFTSDNEPVPPSGNVHSAGRIAYGVAGDYKFKTVLGANAYPLKQVLIDLNLIESDLSSSYTDVVLRSSSNYNIDLADYGPGETIGWVLFGTNMDYADDPNNSYCFAQYGTNLMPSEVNPPGLGYTQPVQYCRIAVHVDLSTNSCTLYADNDLQSPINSGVMLDDVWVMCGTQSSEYYPNYDNAVNIEAYISIKEYLDIRPGVKIE